MEKVLTVDLPPSKDIYFNKIHKLLSALEGTPDNNELLKALLKMGKDEVLSHFGLILAKTPSKFPIPQHDLNASISAEFDLKVLAFDIEGYGLQPIAELCQEQANWVEAKWTNDSITDMRLPGLKRALYRPKGAHRSTRTMHVFSLPAYDAVWRVKKRNWASESGTLCSAYFMHIHSGEVAERGLKRKREEDQALLDWVNQIQHEVWA